MSRTIGDLTFGLTHESLAILALLAGEQPKFAPYMESMDNYDCRIQSFPMYNGRETGVCLTVEKGYMGQLPGDEILHIFFSRGRGGDDILVLWWVAKKAFNAPEFCPDNWEQRRMIKAGHLGEVVDHITDLCEDYFEGRAYLTRNHRSA